MKTKFGDISLYYEQVGSGKPIIMLHGWPLDHLSMKAAMEPIFANREGWRRIYVDLPGRGQSDAPEWLKTRGQILDVVVEFINTVVPDERFCVAGLSYGGLLAQGLVHYLAHRMDGLMFLVTSMATKVEKVPPSVVMHSEPLNLDGLEEGQIDTFKGMAVVQTQAHLDAWKEAIFPGISRANYAFLNGLQGAYSFDAEELDPFPAPTLFLLGRQDSAVGYRDAWRIIENYPHASFVVLDRAGHCLQMEQPKLYKTLVYEWLDRVEEYVAKNGE